MRKFVHDFRAFLHEDEGNINGDAGENEAAGRKVFYVRIVDNRRYDQE